MYFPTLTKNSTLLSTSSLSLLSSLLTQVCVGMFVAWDDWLELLAWVEKNDLLLLSLLSLLQNELHHLSSSSSSSLNSLFLLLGESNVVLKPLHKLNQLLLLPWLLSLFSSSIFNSLICGSLCFLSFSLSFFDISYTNFVSCDDWELKAFFNQLIFSFSKSNN